MNNPEPTTAEELMSQLESDPEWVAQRDERDRQRRRRVEQNRHDAEPLRRELCELGLQVESVADLYNRRMPYTPAIPLLIEWLPRIENPDVKESLVRALSVPEARPSAATPMIREFSAAHDSSGLGLRWAIGNSLAVVADDSVFEQIAELAQDRRWGRAREMIAVALGNMDTHRDEAINVLRRLLDDEEVAGHAVIALGKLRAVEARADVEPFLKHPKAWIQKEAKAALKRIG